METVRPDAALRRRRRNQGIWIPHTQTRDGYDMLKEHQTSRKKMYRMGQWWQRFRKYFRDWIHPIFRYRVRVHHTRDYPSTMWLCPVHRLSRVMDDFHDSQTRVRHISDPRLRVQSSLSFFFMLCTSLVVLVYYPDWVSTLSFGSEVLWPFRGLWCYPWIRDSS